MRYIDVYLPAVKGREIVAEHKVYACVKQKCTACPIKFMCYTTEKNSSISVDFNTWLLMRDYLKYHCEFSVFLVGNRLAHEMRRMSI